MWRPVFSWPRLLFDPFVRLYTASFGMQRICRGDLEKVTKVKLLDRGAPPSLRPRLRGIRPSEKSAVNVKIPQGKTFCQCICRTGTQASAAALTALLRPDCAGSSMCSKGQKDQNKIAFLVLSARRWTFQSLRFVNNGGKSVYPYIT